MTHRERLEKEKSKVIAWYRSGMTMVEIGNKLSVSNILVSETLVSWGVHKKREGWTEEEVQMIRKLKAAGWTIREMAEELKKTGPAVQEKLRRIGMTGVNFTKNTPLPLEQINMNDDYYVLYKGEREIAEGTIDDIAHQLGIKAESVRFYNTNSYKNRGTGENRRVLVHIGKADEFYYE